MIKNIEVEDLTGKRLVAAFVLRETEAADIFIRLKHIVRSDYNRILKVMKEYDGDLLEGLRDTRFDNGMLGLNMFKSIIEVRMKSKDEPEPEILTETQGAAQTKDAPSTEGRKKPVQPTGTVKKRGPGRPRKNPQ